MTPAAAEWDKKHDREVAHNTVIDGKFVPVNRPCDWCGCRVKVGWIHEKCRQAEARKILDAIY